MKKILLKKLEEVTGGILFNAEGRGACEITSIVSDSRKVRDGSLFICIKGEKSDGHDFAEVALASGAVCILAERSMPELKGPYIRVESVFKATKEIAEYYRRSLNVKVVGVTGSVGKTSTKEFVAAVLSQKYKVCKTKGNLNNEWGVPFTIFDIEENDDIAVIEMGINHFGEMNRLSKMARPNTVIMTNIGEAHLEFLGSRDGILKAKSEIFNYMMPDPTVILNGDDDKLISITDAKGTRPIFYGLGRHLHCSAENIEYRGLSGSRFTLVLREGGAVARIKVSLPVPGTPMIYNALAASLAGSRYGVSLMQIKDALENIDGMAGRSQIVETGRLNIIDDSYNASPSAMETSIDILKSSFGRKVAILGDMFELGENSDILHYRVGQYACNSGIDVIVCVGNNSQNIFKGALGTADGKVLYFKTVRDCIEHFREFIRPGDNILVKASHGMNFVEITDRLKSF